MKEIQHALNLLEMKVIKPSDTHWLAHERYKKAVKVRYIALVVTFDSYYQNFRSPESLGLYKALSKFTTIAAILLDYTLPLVAKLSKGLQTKQLDLSMISSLVDAVLHALDDSISLAAYWVLEPLVSKGDLHKRLEKLLVQTKPTHLGDRGTPFVALHKENISSCLQLMIFSALAIFDPCNIPSTDSSPFPTYEKKSIDILLNLYGKVNFLLS